MTVDVLVDAVVMHFTNLELNFVTHIKTNFEQVIALRVEPTTLNGEFCHSPPDFVALELLPR